MAKKAVDTMQRDTFSEGVEVREGQDGAPAAIGGYAAVFGQETIISSPNGVRWRERIAPTAFQAAIGKDDVIAAVNHDHKQVLGRTKAGTLTLAADAHGLRYEVKLGRTTLAQDTVESVRRGDYPGSSFKFAVPDGGARLAEKPSAANPLPLLVIEKVRLIDVGPVTFPAYEGTSVSVRNAPGVVAECYQAEEDAAQRAVEDEAAREAAKTADEKALDAMMAALAERKAWQG